MSVVKVGAAPADVATLGARRSVEISIEVSQSMTNVEYMTRATAYELVGKLAAYLASTEERTAGGAGVTLNHGAVDVLAAALGEAIGVDPDVMRADAELGLAALQLSRGPGAPVIVPKHSPGGFVEAATYAREGAQFCCTGCDEWFATEGEVVAHIVAADALAAGPLTLAELRDLPSRSVVECGECRELAYAVGDGEFGEVYDEWPTGYATLYSAHSACGQGGIRLVRYGSGGQ